MATSSRPKTVPKNYPAKPADYPFGMFRPLLETAQRYLFENELKEVLQNCGLPLDVVNLSMNDFSLTVADIACFVQRLKEFTGDEKGIPYGRDAFRRAVPLFPRGPVGVTSTLRSVSANDKLFLRIRDAMSSYNRQFVADVMAKWHGGAESDLFEDTGQHCYGFCSDQMICQTLTGFLEEVITELSGVKVALTEHECMARGALACR
jgi:hypothetical protein